MHTVFVGTLKARKHLEDLGIDGRIVLKWILNIRSGSVCRPDYFSSM